MTVQTTPYATFISYISCSHPICDNRRKLRSTWGIYIHELHLFPRSRYGTKHDISCRRRRNIFPLREGYGLGRESEQRLAQSFSGSEPTCIVESYVRLITTPFQVYSPNLSTQILLLKQQDNLSYGLDGQREIICRHRSSQIAEISHHPKKEPCFNQILSQIV